MSKDVKIILIAGVTLFLVMFFWGFYWVKVAGAEKQQKIPLNVDEIMIIYNNGYLDGVINVLENDSFCRAVFAADTMIIRQDMEQIKN